MEFKELEEDIVSAARLFMAAEYELAMEKLEIVIQKMENAFREEYIVLLERAYEIYSAILNELELYEEAFRIEKKRESLGYKDSVVAESFLKILTNTSIHYVDGYFVSDLIGVA